MHCPIIIFVASATDRGGADLILLSGQLDVVELLPLFELDDFGNFSDNHERIGFAVRVMDDDVDFQEWPDGALDEDIDGTSNTWGELEIPEFQDIIIPIFCMILPLVVRKMRRKKH